MVQINFAQKSVTVKIVYYGPGMSGKTTNLEIVHQRAPESNKGDLTSISTDGDRTLFFDFMPLDLGTVAGMRTQFQIYTVPGQVYYNSTRKLVLQGVDGVIFVADSGASMLEENLESLSNLAENLEEYGKDIDEIPVVIQYNKRDLPDAMPLDELERHLNPRGWPSFEAIANSGQGVFPTLKSLAARVLDSIHEQTGSGGGSSAAPAPAPPAAAAPAPAPAPAPVPAPAPAPQAAPAPMPPMPQPPPMAPAPEPVQMQQPNPPAPTPAPAPAPLQMAPQPAAAAPAPQPAPMPPQFQGNVPAAPQAPAPAASAAPQMSQSPVAPGPVQGGPMPVAPMGGGFGGQNAGGGDAGLRMAQPAPHRAPQPPAPVAQPQAPAPRPMAPPRSAPAPRTAPQAPAGRLRPRTGATSGSTAHAPAGGGRTAVVTAIIVIVALAAGIAIGGTVFNLI